MLCIRYAVINAMNKARNYKTLYNWCFENLQKPAKLHFRSKGLLDTCIIHRMMTKKLANRGYSFYHNGYFYLVLEFRDASDETLFLLSLGHLFEVVVVSNKDGFPKQEYQECLYEDWQIECDPNVGISTVRYASG